MCINVIHVEIFITQLQRDKGRNMSVKNEYQELRQEYNKSLMPCPFCGGEARLKKHQKLQQTWYVQCNDCGIRTPNSTQAAYESWKAAMEAPVNQWNRRVKDSEKEVSEEGFNV